MEGEFLHPKERVKRWKLERRLRNRRSTQRRSAYAGAKRPLVLQGYFKPHVLRKFKNFGIEKFPQPERSYIEASIGIANEEEPKGWLLQGR